MSMIERMLRQCAWGLSLSFVTFSLLGCGGGGAESLHKVSGTVTYQGNPVPNVTVTFTPTGEAGSGRPGTAITDANGSFDSVTTYNPSDGVIPGSHKITLAVASSGGDSTELDEAAYEEEDTSTLPFPMKYLNTAESDVTVDVSSSGQTLTIELKD